MAGIPVARTLHDIGAAAWFGGALMGAVGVNGAAARVSDRSERAPVASAGWAKWAPVNAAAIGVHLLGGTLVLAENRHRLITQHGVARWSGAKTVLTAGALGATACSGVLGARVAKAGQVPAEGGTIPATDTPPDTAKAMRQLHRLQWAIPAFVGGVLVTSAVLGEQQRPAEVLTGVGRRLGRAVQHAADHPQSTAVLAGRALRHAAS